MDLRELFKQDPASKKALADELGTSEDYIWQIANRWNGRRGSPKMAERIAASKAVRGRVTAGEVLFAQPAANKPKRKKAA